MRFALCFSLLLAALPAFAAPAHPCLFETASEVATMRQQLGHVPLFDAVVQPARAHLEAVLQQPIDVPVPKDAAGYTHERHKQNYVEMQLAGLLYQLSGDHRYVDFVRHQLDRYAQLYPTLGNHPAGTSSSPGRLFHQTLNETVWLVNVAEAYDCVYEALTPEERARYETNIFRPMARFFTVDRAAEFDRIHNHGTWMDVAVGLIGYVMHDPTLVKQALYGTKGDGSAGFLRQLDTLFSPDGYYCEGPYYARYALTPFFLFAEAVQRNQPELDVFHRRHEVLRQALYALLQQTDGTGAFLPFNDALKEKSDVSPEVVFTTDLTYARYGHDPRLLSVARRQGEVSFTLAGLGVAQALQQTPNPPPFPYGSVEFRDGPSGDAGGVALLRSGAGPRDSLAVLKYSSFGMEHGHYDKLSLMYYDEGSEQLTDYGSARFLNIEQKDGGKYLKENATYAKQSIAHNTLVVDERSDYGGVYKQAETAHSTRHFFLADDPNFQVMSARDDTAYPGVRLQRTVALVRDPQLPRPVLIDVFRAVSAAAHDYDYALHYAGTFLDTNVKYVSHGDTQRPLGEAAGYQHLWVEGEGEAAGPVVFSWLNGRTFYSVTSAAQAGTHVFLARIGAHDPKLDLRREPAVILRTHAPAHVFASVVEPHGDWDPIREFTAGEFGVIKNVQVLAATDEATAVAITGAHGLSWVFLVTNEPTPTPGPHHLTVGSETFTWTGPAALQRRPPPAG